MKKAEPHVATTAFGLIIALAVIVSQLFYFPSLSADENQEAKTEQSQSSDSEENDKDVYLSVPTSTAPTSAHVELNPTVFFLFEIIFEHKEVEAYPFDVSLPLSQCFRTLFGLAISPNAP